jgi:hypothetical protein
MSSQNQEEGNTDSVIITELSQLNLNSCIAIKTNKEKCNQLVKSGEQ